MDGSPSTYQDSGETLKTGQPLDHRVGVTIAKNEHRSIEKIDSAHLDL
jgi:hypothetical protein